MSHTANKKKKKRIKWLLWPALLLLIAAVIWQQNRQAVLPAPTMQTPASLPAHTYDWSLLTQDDAGRRQYTAADGSRALVGIDVSKHQGTIEWDKVAADGIDFAIIRVGSRGYLSGDIMADSTFADNLAGATAAGLDVGVYFYSQAVTVSEAEEEADTVLKAIAGRPIDLPVVLDYEEVLHDDARTGRLSNDERTDIALAFCDRVRASGYQVMVYSTRSMLLDRFDLARLETYDIWVADFNDTPGFPYQFSMWQYTPRGRVDGIGPDVDLNLYFKHN